MPIVLLLSALIGFGGAAQSEDGERFTQIQFCDGFLSSSAKQMNLSFYSVYEFQVDVNGRPTDIQAIKEDHTDSEAIRLCFRSWALPDLPVGSTVNVALYWRHGIGCTEMTISGEGIKQRITRSVPEGTTVTTDGAGQ